MTWVHTNQTFIIHIRFPQFCLGTYYYFSGNLHVASGSISGTKGQRRRHSACFIIAMMQLGHWFFSTPLACSPDIDNDSSSKHRVKDTLRPACIGHWLKRSLNAKTATPTGLARFGDHAVANRGSATSTIACEEKNSLARRVLRPYWKQRELRNWRYHNL